MLAQPEKVEGFGVTYKLVVEGSDGGIWRLICRQPVAIEQGDAPADCTVTVSSADFVALLERRLNPQTAFLAGRIKVSGNIGLALKLAQLF